MRARGRVSEATDTEAAEMFDILRHTTSKASTMSTMRYPTSPFRDTGHTQQRILGSFAIHRPRHRGAQLRRTDQALQPFGHKVVSGERRRVFCHCRRGEHRRAHQRLPDNTPSHGRRNQSVGIPQTFRQRIEHYGSLTTPPLTLPLKPTDENRRHN